MQRMIRTGLWLVIGVFGVLIIVAAIFAIVPVQPSLSPGKPLVAPFSLQDHEGRPITEQAFLGQPSAVFFGFTHCPDVCPTTLYELSSLTDELGRSGERLTIYLVTVDPERDTPAVLKSYVTAVSDRIVGITGPPENVRAMVKSTGIYAKRVDQEDGGYSMDHTATVLLLNEKGELAGTISYGEDRRAALDKLRRLVR